MKKTKTDKLAKKAKKAAKKDLTQKIAAQIKSAIADLGPELKKAEKSIEKAAKNLAKKIAKLTKEKANTSTPAINAAPVKQATEGITKNSGVVIESQPIKAMPAKSANKPAPSKIIKAPIGKAEAPKK